MDRIVPFDTLASEFMPFTNKPSRQPSSELASDEPARGDDSRSELVSIPRWIVYFQGAMLGVVAATFFVFGLMVGNLTSGAGSLAEQKIGCRISGQVLYSREGALVADTGAVVMLLPMELKPEERFNSMSLHPKTFEPLDNPSIDCVTSLGGAVVRVNNRGTFDFMVDGPQEYYVLIVSANQDRDGTLEFTKLQKAAVGTFFKPAEGLIGDQAFYWSTLYADRDAIRLPTVEFE